MKSSSGLFFVLSLLDMTHGLRIKEVHPTLALKAHGTAEDKFVMCTQTWGCMNVPSMWQTHCCPFCAKTVPWFFQQCMTAVPKGARGSSAGAVTTRAAEETAAHFGETSPFGGATLNADGVFSFPTASSDHYVEDWAGFADENVRDNGHSFSFSSGGKITFKAEVLGSSDVELYFKFEKNSYPDVDPWFTTAHVTVPLSGGSGTDYEVDIPAQDAANTYRSFLLFLGTRDVDIKIHDVVVHAYLSEGTQASQQLSPVQASQQLSSATTATTITADLSGAFGDASYDEEASKFTFPALAHDWAGFADISGHSFNFPDGGKITFNAEALGGNNVELYFKFEYMAHPHVDPWFRTANVTVASGGEANYEVDIPAQDAANTYHSFLLYLETRDVDVMLHNVVVHTY